MSTTTCHHTHEPRTRRPAPPFSTSADTVVMTLLHDHVPLALLCDLTLTDGPTSAAILAAEGEPETRWWER